MLRLILMALRTVFLRRRLEREMQEEMAAHLAPVGLPLGIVVLWFLATNFGLPFPNATALSAAIAPVVLAVAAIATWIPARRATGIDPLNALRAQ